jgi:hypothetical protein
MRIVLTVTPIAICCRHDFRNIPRNVAGVTIEIAMRAHQRVAGLGVVIESPPLPTIGVVANRAARAEATFVMFIPVAVDAIQRRILVRRRSMALFARYDRVASDKRKSSEVVIERDCSAPTDLSVTFLAVAAKLSLVAIILPVTGNARRRQLVAVEIAGVTGIALNLRMRAS